MNELFEMAEKEMLDLNHLYVGTEHFMLSYLKKYGNKFISYNEFREYVIDIMGKSYKKSEYILYTPLLRKIKNESSNIYDVMVKILTEDSITYNILLSKNKNIEDIYLDVIKNNSLINI